MRASSCSSVCSRIWGGVWVYSWFLPFNPLMHCAFRITCWRITMSIFFLPEVGYNTDESSSLSCIAGSIGVSRWRFNNSPPFTWSIEYARANLLRIYLCIWPTDRCFRMRWGTFAAPHSTSFEMTWIFICWRRDFYWSLLRSVESCGILNEAIDGLGIFWRM